MSSDGPFTCATCAKLFGGQEELDEHDCEERSTDAKVAKRVRLKKH